MTEDANFPVYLIQKNSDYFKFEENITLVNENPVKVEFELMGDSKPLIDGSSSVKQTTSIAETQKKSVSSPIVSKSNVGQEDSTFSIKEEPIYFNAEDFATNESDIWTLGHYYQDDTEWKENFDVTHLNILQFDEIKIEPTEEEEEEELQVIEWNRQLEAAMCNLPELLCDSSSVRVKLDKDVTNTEEEKDKTSNLISQALKLNEKLQNIFVIYLDFLNKKKRVNLNKQKNIEEDLVKLKWQQKKLDNVLGWFGIPYFKDQLPSSKKLVVFNLPDPSKEALKAKEIGFHPIVFRKLIRMKEREELKLRMAVRKELILLKYIKCMNERARLEEQEERQRREGRGTMTTVKQLTKIYRYVYKLSDDENVSNDGLFYDSSIHRVELINWAKIARETFPNSRYSADDLRLFWQHYLRPDIKVGPKSVEEKRVLKSLLANVNLEYGVDWKRIAETLAIKTGSKFQRTEYDCFCYFQCRLNTVHRRFGWTKEANYAFGLLLDEHFTRAGHNPSLVNWAEIAAHFPGRTKTQVYSHWKYATTKLDRSPYSRAEDEVIRKGISLGFTPREIAQLMGDKRTPFQIKCRHRILMKVESVKIESGGWIGSKKKWKMNQDRRQTAFGKKLVKILGIYATQAMLRQNEETDTHSEIEIPVELTNAVVKLVNQDPRLDLGVVKKEKSRGRPCRNKSAVELEEELQKMIRPLEFVKNRRPRLASYPGDGREHGLALFALYRLLGVEFDRRKTPPVESSADVLLDAGIQPPDHTSYVTLMTMIDELPARHCNQEPIRHLSDDHPPPESLLPPTLHTLTGLRGLFVYRDSLKAQAQAGQFNLVKVDGSKDDEVVYTVPDEDNQPGCDAEIEIVDVEPFGDPCVDRQLYYLLESVFYWAGILVQNQSSEEIDDFGVKTETPEQQDKKPIISTIAETESD